MEYENCGVDIEIFQISIERDYNSLDEVAIAFNGCIASGDRPQRFKKAIFKAIVRRFDSPHF